MEDKLVQVLVQGGAVGIAITLIFVIYKMWDKHVESSEKVLDVIKNNAVAMNSLKISVEENTKVTRATKALMSETKQMMVHINGYRK